MAKQWHILLCCRTPPTGGVGKGGGGVRRIAVSDVLIFCLSQLDIFRSMWQGKCSDGAFQGESLRTFRLPTNRIGAFVPQSLSASPFLNGERRTAAQTQIFSGANQTLHSSLRRGQRASVRKRSRARIIANSDTNDRRERNVASGGQLKVAVLVSGSGRSLENLCERISAGILRGCRIQVVVASKKTAGAIDRAKKYGIETRVIRLKDYEGETETFSEAISSVLDEFQVDLVVMAGWMHFYQIPQRHSGKVINIHPSLIPAFCGKGYYGSRVHEAVVKFGAKITGCTVHLADNKYDHGPIILQKAVPVLDNDTADDVGARVFECEKEALPEAIQLFVDGRLIVENGVVKTSPASQASHV